MGRSRFKIQEDYYPYFVTTSVVDGISLFAVAELSGIVTQAMEFLQKDSDSML